MRIVIAYSPTGSTYNVYISNTLIIIVTERYEKDSLTCICVLYCKNVVVKYF